jgi:RimJ/RimL family protein N-acetyltransferase
MAADSSCTISGMALACTTKELLDRLSASVPEETCHSLVAMAQASGRAWMLLDGEGRVRVAALHAFGRLLTVGPAASPENCRAIARAVHAALSAEEREAVGGMMAPTDSLHAFVDEWRLLSPGWSLKQPLVLQGNWMLHPEWLARPASPPAGRMEQARAEHVELLAQMQLEFTQHLHASGFTMSPVPSLDDCRKKVISMVDAGLYFVWTDGESGESGESGIRSMVAFSGRTPLGVRLGNVFTPAPCRRRGYSEALCAAVCEHAFSALGCTRVYLYTDLAYPASNALYQKLGFRPLLDTHAFASFSQ